MDRPAITSRIYDAAERVLARHPLPDDCGILLSWAGQTSRDAFLIAVEVVGIAAWPGYGRECRG